MVGASINSEDQQARRPNKHQDVLFNQDQDRQFLDPFEGVSKTINSNYSSTETKTDL